MWDGDPVYCQECGHELSCSFTLPTGKGVCGSCARKFRESDQYHPLPCSNCQVIPECLYSRDGLEGLLCHNCDELLYGKVSPEDLFDHAMQPYGGRLKLPPPKPDEECTPEELAQRKSIRAMFSGYQICGVQPISKPSGLIFAMKERYEKGENFVSLDRKSFPSSLRV